ncbi:hypothetical protein M011DRAFT_481977 [Sporormia fimetaria CBS 119925]|uniref:VOC domain-containing protein n=1 Tax=Sporormia fimetaria CBS 119925 TaxID=1340428 RepID=A0A6A6UXH5_9PLEO|nr:hypothetical protein M011DRAFT_481977 [Sporormia fimetaria CBS 119925]
MFDHMGFDVHPSKFNETVNFYTAALAPLGISKQMEFPGEAVGFGRSKIEPPFWVAAKKDAEGVSERTDGLHIAFSATDHATVERFHEEAVKAGGTCNGKPGLRPQYHPNYYAAFVKDPVGNNIEIVDHSPQ